MNVKIVIFQKFWLTIAQSKRCLCLNQTLLVTFNVKSAKFFWLTVLLVYNSLSVQLFWEKNSAAIFPWVFPVIKVMTLFANYQTTTGEESLTFKQENAIKVKCQCDNFQPTTVCLSICMLILFITNITNWQLQFFDPQQFIIIYVIYNHVLFLFIQNFNFFRKNRIGFSQCVI